MAVQILGLNEAGHEAYTDMMCDGRDLPWLQDVAEVGVWSLWGVTYRDVLVLDGDGVLVDVYNLTEHDLTQGTDDLRAILEDAAP